MIKISSFYPFQGFLRITQEFHKDKAFVKIKSLTFEREREFNYEEVVEISDAFIMNTGQMNFSFWILLILVVGSTYLRHNLYITPVFLQIAQLLFICMMILFVSSFKRTWRILLSDRNDNLLAYIDQTTGNRDLVPQIVELIRSKSVNVLEFSATCPFPEQEPIFEHTEYDFSNLSRATERFYEDKMIGWQKGVYSEYVYHILYSRLTDKIHHGKTNNDIASEVLSFCCFLFSIFGGLIFLFGVQFGKQIIYLLYFFMGLFIISLPISLLKRETVGLYNNEGKVHYWTYTNRKNKAHVKK